MVIRDACNHGCFPLSLSKTTSKHTVDYAIGYIFALSYVSIPCYFCFSKDLHTDGQPAKSLVCRRCTSQEMRATETSSVWLQETARLEIYLELKVADDKHSPHMAMISYFPRKINPL